MCASSQEQNRAWALQAIPEKQFTDAKWKITHFVSRLNFLYDKTNLDCLTLEIFRTVYRTVIRKHRKDEGLRHRGGKGQKQSCEEGGVRVSERHPGI